MGDPNALEQIFRRFLEIEPLPQDSRPIPTPDLRMFANLLNLPHQFRAGGAAAATLYQSMLRSSPLPVDPGKLRHAMVLRSARRGLGSTIRSRGDSSSLAWYDPAREQIGAESWELESGVRNALQHLRCQLSIRRLPCDTYSSTIASDRIHNRISWLGLRADGSAGAISVSN